VASPERPLRAPTCLCRHFAQSRAFVVGQRGAGVASRGTAQVGRGAGRDEGAAGVAAFGAEIDDPVRGADHVEIVLDHDDRVAGRDEPIERGDELLDVREVQTRRRLVEQEELRAAAAAAGVGELAGELQPLRLAARQRRHRLTQAQVVEPDVDERSKTRADVLVVCEVGHGLGHRHVEHVGDRLRLALTAEREPNVEDLAAVAPPVAVGAA
jgi:hypothetical protein